MEHLQSTPPPSRTLPVFHNPYLAATTPTHLAHYITQHLTRHPSHLSPISHPFPQTTQPRNHTTPLSHSIANHEQSLAVPFLYPAFACHAHRSCNCAFQRTCEPPKLDNSQLLSCYPRSGGKVECSPPISIVE